MNQAMPAWAALVSPVASLLGTMLIVMMGVYLQNRALERAIDLLRAELRQQMAELRQELVQRMAEMELRLTKQILDLTQRVERLEEARGLIRTS